MNVRGSHGMSNMRARSREDPEQTLRTTLTRNDDGIKHFLQQRRSKTENMCHVETYLYHFNK